MRRMAAYHIVFRQYEGGRTVFSVRCWREWRKNGLHDLASTLSSATGGDIAGNGSEADDVPGRGNDTLQSGRKERQSELSSRETSSTRVTSRPLASFSMVASVGEDGLRPSSF